jgi:hypothetical protein
MKPRFVIITLVIFALAVPTLMLAQQNSKAEKEISALLEESKRANLKGGAEAAAVLDKYLADDFVRIPSNGSIINKAELLDGFKAGSIKVESLELSDVKIRIYGHTAVVTGIEAAKGTMLGREYSTKTRWTRVLVKRDGMWKILLNQSTRMLEPAKQ